jgi:hypothetical protein
LACIVGTPKIIMEKEKVKSSMSLETPEEIEIEAGL